MMRHALKMRGCSRKKTVIVGDRMDADIMLTNFFGVAV
jgi:predicted HAD superfamily phosphohydrolase YqeG